MTLGDAGITVSAVMDTYTCHALNTKASLCGEQFSLDLIQMHNAAKLLSLLLINDH